jgi:branched-chain amino acid transport system substrate-binding protein
MLNKASDFVGLLLLLIPVMSLAARKYDAGVSDTGIKLGQTMPYSGPLSSFANSGKV